MLEVVYSSARKSADKPSTLKMTFKTANECATSHTLIKRVMDERAPLLDTAASVSTPPVKSPRQKLTLRPGSRRIGADPSTSPSPVPRAAQVTLRNKDKGVVSVIAPVLEACPTRSLVGGSSFQRKMDGSSQDDLTPSLFVVQDVATVNVVAGMAAGDLVLYTLDPGTIFAPDPSFFG